ncbi:hypothetical protein [Ilumatobacter sp.]|uniref:hypothetical protein n=1 Tax=Ilumatobacter sp. TaxID=1967498 RepID=UPI003AF43F64
MGFRDRFYTPTTAKALLSWRILVGVGVGAALAVAGLPIALAAAAGVGVYAATVVRAMPRGARRPAIDPFVLSEPWRQLIQGAQGSARKLRSTVSSTDDGPLRSTMEGIVDQLEHGLDEAWEIAKRGDEIDDAVRRLDPTALRSKLDTLRGRAEASPSPDADAAVASIERQLATAERLKLQSADTAAALQRTQTQLDELVARASEVRIGAVDTEVYRQEVDDLVIRLEALHQAVEETRSA